MEIRISPNLNSILDRAVEEAMRTGWTTVEPDHLLLGILRHRENDAARVIEDFGIDPAEMKDFIDSTIFRHSPVAWSDRGRIKVSGAARNLLNLAAFEAIKAGQDEISAVHLLLALMKNGSGCGRTYLEENGIDAAGLQARLKASGKLTPGVRNVTPVPEEIPQIIRISRKNEEDIFS